MNLFNELRNGIYNARLAKHFIAFMRGPRKVCQRGSNSGKVFFLDFFFDFCFSFLKLFLFFVFLIDEGREPKYHSKRAIICLPG